MKVTRKLIPALAMLLVSAVVMSSASYAWFTMSRQVTAQGMNVTVTAPNNLMIKKTGAEDTTYSEIYTYTNETAIQLQPASTNSGKKTDIYVVQDGQPLHAAGTKEGQLYNTTDDGKDTLLAVAKEASAADLNGISAGYVDFKYTLKTDAQSDVKIVVNNITVAKHEGAGEQSLNPVRVAVLKADESVVKVFKPVTDAKNFNNQLVDTISGASVASLTADTSVYTSFTTTNDSTNAIVTLNASGAENTSATAEIIVRIWYEGQDEECIVENAKANFDVTVVLADVASLTPAP